MYAWEIEAASSELRGLQHEEWEDTALAALTFVLALAATQLFPTLAVPLAIGALAVALLALRAFWRHWELLDRLLLDQAAYQIQEVRRRAERSATMKNRHWLAESIRSMLKEPGYTFPGRVGAAAEELGTLARELDDAALSLDPASAVACERLLTDGGLSPLFNPALPADDTRASLRQIRAGFDQRRATV
ncbi:MAG TPA: hypothetical protein VGP69_10760 [Gaiellaceae bacterium]|jgi:hypothetical protein|nr:hypothetical protein [Gaiellaceae bacterium]